MTKFRLAAHEPRRALTARRLMVNERVLANFVLLATGVVRLDVRILSPHVAWCRALDLRPPSTLREVATDASGLPRSIEIEPLVSMSMRSDVLAGSGVLRLLDHWRVAATATDAGAVADTSTVSCPPQGGEGGLRGPLDCFRCCGFFHISHSRSDDLVLHRAQMPGHDATDIASVTAARPKSKSIAILASFGAPRAFFSATYPPFLPPTPNK